MSYNKYNEDNTTQLRDINEKIQELIVDSLRTSEILYIKGDYINSYRAIKNVFWKIAPFDFKRKQTLIDYTNNIDEYLEAVEGRDSKPDMAQLIKIGETQYQLKHLIEQYLKLIPECLRELNLYLRIVKRQDDPSEAFSDESFTTKDSLIPETIKQLETVKDVKTLLKNMTPRQLLDVHARLLTYRDMGGMKKLSEIKDEDED